MAGTLEGKPALVTGGSSGIGRLMALAFTRSPGEAAKAFVADISVARGVTPAEAADALEARVSA